MRDQRDRTRLEAKDRSAVWAPVALPEGDRVSEKIGRAVVTGGGWNEKFRPRSEKTDRLVLACTKCPVSRKSRRRAIRWGHVAKELGVTLPALRAAITAGVGGGVCLVEKNGPTGDKAVGPMEGCLSGLRYPLDNRESVADPALRGFESLPLRSFTNCWPSSSPSVLRV